MNPKYAKNALVSLNRLAEWRPADLALLEEQLAMAPGVLLPLAIEVAVVEGGVIGLAIATTVRRHCDYGLCRQLEHSIPWSTVVLREAAVEVQRKIWSTFEKLTEQIHATAPGELHDIRQFVQPRYAVALSDYSRRLRASGRLKEALVAATDASAIFRLLSDQDPVLFRGGFADSLVDLSICLGKFGRWDESLEHATTAVAICRQMAERVSRVINPPLADSFSSALRAMSNCLTNLERHEEALALANEALSIYRRRIERIPLSFLAYLEGSLIDVLDRLCGFDRHELTKATSTETIAILRKMAEQKPDAFQSHLSGSLAEISTCLPGLAVSLIDVSDCLYNLGQREEALATATAATAIYRKLADEDPDAFKSNLAISLKVQSTCLHDSGRCSESLASMEEALVIFRQLTEGNSPAFKSDLARSLDTFATWLDESGLGEKALASTAEAKALRHQLNQVTKNRQPP